MPVFELTRDAINRLPETTLAGQGFRERQDLQRLLRAQIEIISPDSFVLAEEYSEWEDARRSIDLLCIDKDANLIVVELKRSEDGGHMELQAIRYAAMVSKMTFAEAVDAHEKYLQRTGGTRDEAETAILRFLDWDEPRREFGQNVNIVLVSADFSKEITTSVIWLNECGLNVRCVRLRPYLLGDRTLLDIEQVLPLPEAEQYQVRLRRKAAEAREAQESTSDWSRYDLTVGSETFPSLYKRGLFLAAVRGLVQRGVLVSAMCEVLPARKFLGIDGKLSASEFTERASQLKRDDGTPRDLRRYFLDEQELFFSEGKTWALSNQWSRHQLPKLDELIARNPDAGIRYAKTVVDDEALSAE